MGGFCILRARERKERKAERSRRLGEGRKARVRGGWEKGTKREDGRRTTTITLKAVRDTPAMVLIYRPRFPSPRCHGFHGVLVIIRTFRPPSTFASQPPPPPPSLPLPPPSLPTASLSSATTSVPAARRAPPSPSLPSSQPPGVGLYTL